jgi:hypothetical protein
MLHMSEFITFFRLRMSKTGEEGEEGGEGLGMFPRGVPDTSNRRSSCDGNLYGVPFPIKDAARCVGQRRP